jgi:hypothetical protein
MGERVKKVTEYLRHNFSDAELLIMGSEQAQAHSELGEIELEFDSVKASFKNRTAAVEAKIGSLSRNINNRFEMRNIECALEYDVPNVGEVTYRRTDTGEAAKVRPMTEKERQMDLPLETSQNNVLEFFAVGSTGAKAGADTDGAKTAADAPQGESGPAPGIPEEPPTLTESIGDAPTPEGEKVPKGKRSK